MKVEIWSDVMCPFCYIGKRRFEQALERFGHKDDIEVEWKSFQLDPGMQTMPGKSINQYLAERKGCTIEQAKQLNSQVIKMALNEGLIVDLYNSVVANSFDAHRFGHLAKQNGVGIEAAEALFKAYFTDGKNIANHEVLAQLGEEIGLDGVLIKRLLSGEAFKSNVAEDIHQAEEIGVHGVPFFVLNRQYAVSGAQNADVFLSALEKSHSEWQLHNIVSTTVGSDDFCAADGNCH